MTGPFSFSRFQFIQTVTILMAFSFGLIERAASRLTTTALFVCLHVLLCLGSPPNAAGQISRSETQRKHHAKNSLVIPECRIHVASDVSLAFEKSGTLEFLAPAGSSVKNGQVIAQLRDSVARASYLIAERESSNDIEIRFAKKAGQLAQLKYERAQQADRSLSGTVTEFELRELRLAAEQSLLQLQQAEHQLAIAGLKKNEQLELLKSLQITSPFDGYVRSIKKQRGEFLREGETVLEVVNDKLIRVDGFVNLSDLANVSIGDPVDIYSDRFGNSVRFRGTINFVDKKIEPVSMKVKVSAIVHNVDSLLKDGLLMTMEILPANTSQLSSR